MVKKIVKRSESSIGQIIEAEISEVKEVLEKLSYGELKNVLNNLRLKYQEVETMKNAILQQKKQDKNASDIVKDTLAELYLVLQKIEEKCSLVVEIQKTKKVDER